MLHERYGILLLKLKYRISVSHLKPNKLVMTVNDAAMKMMCVYIPHPLQNIQNF